MAAAGAGAQLMLKADFTSPDHARHSANSQGGSSRDVEALFSQAISLTTHFTQLTWQQIPFHYQLTTYEGGFPPNNSTVFQEVQGALSSLTQVKKQSCNHSGQGL